MIERWVLDRSNGVNVDSGASRVRFPLLLTNAVLNWRPKKLAVKPIGTAPVEPSSLAGNSVMSKPGRVASRGSGGRCATGTLKENVLPLGVVVPDAVVSV